MADQFKTYTKFSRHVDNSQEVISAKDTNKVQKAVNTVESNVVSLHAGEFMNKVIFVFDNNIYVNQMFVDLFETQQFLNMSKSYNSVFNPIERVVSIGEEASTAILYTESMLDTNDIPPNKYVVMVDYYMPPGSDLKFFISLNNVDYYPVRVNEVTRPNDIKFKDDIGAMLNMTMKVEMKKNLQGESPKISGYAVMYFDASVERMYGLTNPDLSPFDTETMGDIILVRDRLQNDRLVKVIEPDVVTTLTYNSLGELDEVKTASATDTVVESLIYGNYVNSKGAIERVLLKVSRSKETVEDQITDDQAFEEGGGAP